MNLNLNITLAEGYKSNSQIARVLTENWVKENSYCPCCGEIPLNEFENNRPVADFYCKKCNEEFELKSKSGKFSNTINDGAYSTMIERINSNQNPNFFFLTYSKKMSVENFLIIPKQFFTTEIIIKRKPLSDTAKRAGWIGCNIDLSNVAEVGKVFLIKDSKLIDKEIVENSFKKTLFLRQKSNESKGWILDVMNCIDSINTEKFTLEDVYKFEEKLKLKYPSNNFIKDKIRQQLQFLRDKGIIEFSGRGNYKKNLMGTFKIEVQEFLARVVEIDAKDVQDAFAKVQMQYKNEKIVLDYNDFVDVNFIDINTQSKEEEKNILIKDIIEYIYVDEQKHFEESNKPENHIFNKLKRLKLLID